MCQTKNLTDDGVVNLIIRRYLLGVGRGWLGIEEVWSFITEQIGKLLKRILNERTYNFGAGLIGNQVKLSKPLQTVHPNMPD